MSSFRAFLADNDVVLAVTKLLLAMRRASPSPENPKQFVRDYFADYRDPLWEEMDQLKKENQALREQQIPEKEAQIA